MAEYEFVHNGKAFTPNGEAAEAEGADERNRVRSNAEVEAFKARHNDRWFGYWRDVDGTFQGPGNVGPVSHRIAEICTWMGDVLATVTWKGAEYSSPAFGGFPSKRINFRARGIDGRMWAGTYYKSSGDYVRMRVVK